MSSNPNAAKKKKKKERKKFYACIMNFVDYQGDLTSEWEEFPLLSTCPHAHPPLPPQLQDDKSTLTNNTWAHAAFPKSPLLP
jgi:hypothetical protein